jgi:hypothetical protein
VRLRESQGDRRAAGHQGASSGIDRVVAFGCVPGGFVVAFRFVVQGRSAPEIAPIDVGPHGISFPFVGVSFQRALSRSCASGSALAVCWEQDCAASASEDRTDASS